MFYTEPPMEKRDEAGWHWLKLLNRDGLVTALLPAFWRPSVEAGAKGEHIYDTREAAWLFSGSVFRSDKAYAVGYRYVEACPMPIIPAKERPKRAVIEGDKRVAANAARRKASAAPFNMSYEDA